MSERRPVRVLFDVFELSPQSGKSIGIYVYAIGLLRALATTLPEGVQLVVACHGDNWGDLQAAAGPRVELVCLADRHPGLLRRQWWWRLGAYWTARRLRCRAYFSPKGFMPGWFGRAWGLQTCVVVHDLIPLWYADHFPGYFNRLEQWLVNQGLLRTCRHADQVIAISQATAEDIAQRSGRTGPIAVIHNGLDELGAEPGATEHWAAVPAGPYILAMCSDLPHKNAAGVLEGYRLYRQSQSMPLPMVVCGLVGDAPEGVTFVKGVSRVVLSRLFREAELFVFLSRTEGFGYPPLEAMQQGTMSICSDIKVLRETTQGHAWFVDPLSPSALASTLRQVLSPEFEATRRKMAYEAPAVARRYQWSQTAQQVGAVFRQWLRI